MSKTKESNCKVTEDVYRNMIGGTLLVYRNDLLPEFRDIPIAKLDLKHISKYGFEHAIIIKARDIIFVNKWGCKILKNNYNE